MSDFERIFGAGASMEKIIDSIDRNNQLEKREKEVISDRNSKKKFNTFQEPADWTKRNSEQIITRPPDGNRFFEVTKNIYEKREFFTISINPGDIKVTDSYSAQSTSWSINEMMSDPELKMDSIRNYLKSLVSINGISEEMVVTRSPLPRVEMLESIVRAGWRLYPVSTSICLLDNVDYADDEGSIDGALITENGRTSIISGNNFSKRMHDALVRSD